jgi:hypothetical protein
MKRLNYSQKTKLNVAYVDMVIDKMTMEQLKDCARYHMLYIYGDQEIFENIYEHFDGNEFEVKYFMKNHLHLSDEDINEYYQHRLSKFF